MNSNHSQTGFSLAEVVLALGVISIGIIAIIGIVPIGLSTNHSSQGETRATQIAQDIFAALEIQARPSPSPVLTLNTQAYVNQQSTIAGPTTNPFVFNNGPIDLSQSTTLNWGADSDGNLQASYTPALPYQVTVSVVPNPPGFNTGYSSTVMIHVAWQPVTQNYRDFSKIISRY